MKDYRIIGRKGGTAGKGLSKVRGNSDHYRRIVQMRWAKRKAAESGKETAAEGISMANSGTIHHEHSSKSSD